MQSVYEAYSNRSLTLTRYEDINTRYAGKPDFTGDWRRAEDSDNWRRGEAPPAKESAGGAEGAGRHQ